MNFIAKLILVFFVSLVTEWILVGLMAVFKQWKTAWVIARVAHILRGGVVLVWCAGVVKVIWGSVWMWVGLGVGLAPIVPMALIATAINGLWVFWAEFWIAILIMWVSHLLSIWQVGMRG
jgi:hypothetical protein